MRKKIMFISSLSSCKEKIVFILNCRIGTLEIKSLKKYCHSRLQSGHSLLDLVASH